jgi:hypothetical protein
MCYNCCTSSNNTNTQLEGNEEERKQGKPCQNNKLEENSNLRQQRLMYAMETYPDQFWGDATTASIETGDDARIVPTETATTENEAWEETSTDKPTTTDGATNEEFGKMWKDLQRLISQQIETIKANDDAAMDTTTDNDDGNVDEFHRLERFSQKTAKSQNLTVNDGDIIDPTSTFPSKVLRSVSKDLLLILQSMRTSRSLLRNDDVISASTDQESQSVKRNSNNQYPFLDIMMNETSLLCSEDFPESSSEASAAVAVSGRHGHVDDDDDDDEYVQNLINETTFATSGGGGGSDPNVRRYLCYEEGLFEGDTNTISFEDPENKKEGRSAAGKRTEEMVTAQKLAVIQETTRLIRAKTLELTKKRLKQQR